VCTPCMPCTNTPRMMTLGPQITIPWSRAPTCRLPAGGQRAGGRALYQRQAAVVASTRSRPSRCVCARVGCVRVCAPLGPVVLPYACRRLLQQHGARPTANARA
jgi:hypothetical protein